jgi:hypothetical protein
MTSAEHFEEEIKKIKERNRRVEADKTWETSWTRRIFIGVSTYLLISIFLVIIKAEKPFLSAIIPAVAYVISTLSLGLLRSWWLKRQSKNG